VRQPSLREAQEYCRQFTRRHSENFSVATLFLPRRLIPHFYAVYAFCRYADDLGDESESPEAALTALATWRDELLQAYGGHPRHPIIVALRDTIEAYQIPREPFLDLISAFEQDQRIREYETYSQLLDYCRRSANPVGRILLHLFECFDESRAEFADHICTALQLTNFWQDVKRDYDIGRVYLPREDRIRFGYSDDDLRANRFSPSFAELMRFEIERAREFFQRGLRLVQQVPDDVAIDVELFARGGLGILGKIERQGYNVWQRRPRLTRLEKAGLMCGVVGGYWRNRLWPRSKSAVP
jgi:squalene synthase HpnC